jgi:hypothetical protein
LSGAAQAVAGTPSSSSCTELTQRAQRQVAHRPARYPNTPKAHCIRQLSKICGDLTTKRNSQITRC